PRRTHQRHGRGDARVRHAEDEHRRRIQDPAVPAVMRVVAIEEHFSTPQYRQKVSANEARSPYIQARSAELGHDIGAELDDPGAARLKHLDAPGIDVQVLSCNAPVTQGFTNDEALAMTKELNAKVAAAMR